MSFDGTNDYVTLRDSEEYPLRFNSGAQDFSVVAWFRRGESGANHIIIDKRDASGDGWVFFVAGNDRVYGILDGIDCYGAVGAVNDGLWHCAVWAVDRSANMLIYVDGVEGAGFAVGAEVMATTTVPRIGAQSFDADNKFIGDIAGIVVWNRILTADECAALATPGRAF